MSKKKYTMTAKQIRDELNSLCEKGMGHYPCVLQGVNPPQYLTLAIIDINETQGFVHFLTDTSDGVKERHE